MGLLGTILQAVLSAYMLAVAVVPQIEDLIGPGNGVTKRQAAIDKITRDLGCDLPAWLDGALATAVGYAVEWAVAQHNRMGTTSAPTAAALTTAGKPA